MKLADTLLFSFAILCLLIGIHEAMTHGFMAGYWLFMLSLGALLWYQVRKKNQAKDKTASSTKKDIEQGNRKRKYKM